MSQVKLTTSVRPAGDALRIVDIQGEITSFAEAALTEAYNQASSSGAKTVLLNFQGLEYMNSSGIGLLVTVLIRANRQNQTLAACGLSEHYRQIFELTRLNEAIQIFNSEAEALTALSQG